MSMSSPSKASDGMPTRYFLRFWVNGNQVIEHKADPEMTLLTYLRNKMNLTGTKLGCGEGGCGACTVTVRGYEPVVERVISRSVNACLATLCSVDGMSVMTVEGIGSTAKGLHPVQEKLANGHGSQCGFCTPGIVMSMFTLLQNKRTPTEEELEDAFDGNLCRCTGYRPILEAYKSFGVTDRADETVLAKVDGPSAQALKDEYDSNTTTHLVIEGDRCTYHRPCTLDSLLAVKNTSNDAKLVRGNTGIGVEAKFRGARYKNMVSTTMVPILNRIRVDANAVHVGGSVSLTNIGDKLKSLCQSEPEPRCRGFQALLENLRWFGGEQIRNVSSLAGNLVHASPVSDLNPILMATSAYATIVSSTGNQRVVQCKDFFISHRKTILAPDEIVLSISLPFTNESDYVMAFKQSKRREHDIAIVNSCMKVSITRASTDAGGKNIFKITDAQLAFGGMADTAVSATKTAAVLVGKDFQPINIQDALNSLKDELALPVHVQGGMGEYRQALCAGFFLKFWTSIASQLSFHGVDDRSLSATHARGRPSSKSCQYWNNATSTKTPVGDPIKHMSASKQASGEARYIDDTPIMRGELQSALVLSTKAHAKIIKVDVTAALKLSGVKGYFDHTHVPGKNAIGPIAKDELIFIEDIVTAVGQPIGIIVANTRAQAQEAVAAARVDYEELTPIISIEDAIAAKSYIRADYGIEKGNLTEGFAASDHVLEGEQRIGGQEHFYLEPNGSIAVPKGEDGEMEIIASTQSPQVTQMHVAETLGVPANRIVCRVKRMGGAFGGKETRSVLVSTAAAVAAHHCGVPVRCILERDEDMIATGGRHPFLAKYKVGFTKAGKVLALDIKLYSNAGYSMDLSDAVMDCALLHVDNVYKIPNVRCLGYTCRTNLITNTAFRGFGVPQSLFFAETWMTDVANYCKLPNNQVREANFYEEGDSTHFNQKLDSCQLDNVWKQLHQRCEYSLKTATIAKFNEDNQYKKRGIAITPTKFGVSFGAPFLNQAGALIQIYTDGSVLLTHGGTEMGQGLHTKMIQCCARALDISIDKIHITETSTNTVPNTSPTGASISSDLNGMAILDAARQINERLAPYKEKCDGASWEEIITTAYFDRVSLSAAGFYKTPGLGYDFKKNEGRAFNYFTFGAACSEVEIDVLTGDHQILSTAIVMDVGSSLNPALDIGQIEGAFVQGVGLFTIEDMLYSPTGETFTRGPGTYKIPGFKDIPIDFSVELLRNAPNDRAVYSSKAVGEPPLFLGASVFFAIKEAIRAARAEFGIADPIFRLDSPATVERIRMACGDEIAQSFPRVSGERWNKVA